MLLRGFVVMLSLRATLAEMKLAVAPESGRAESRLPLIVIEVLGVEADVMGDVLNEEVDKVMVSTCS